MGKRKAAPRREQQLRMQKCGGNHRDLAGLAGVHVNTIFRYMRGLTNPTALTEHKIEQALLKMERAHADAADTA